ncbi:Glutamine-dependent NAD(+) synthetase [Tepidimonas alkaliphilus]|uniref:Glutamine-dependent NAD(+) synthetase n=1 Tax=Tepidimonas alkaliphilus TaxID=2588942 RepID=A0A554WDJ0_9BURK|nr:NAD+ synthase [Tepidimonas alkaliphilus]TSE21650.1 Glutamine-dependent NAD(+) synthetase [Tepidimonas alkaliphilus]
MGLKIAAAQLNLVVGDLVGNTRRLVESAQAAYAAGARVLLTPELAICGYPAEDWLLRPSFVADCEAAVRELARCTASLRGLHMVVGHPWLAPAQDSGGCARAFGAISFNAASVLHEGAVTHRYAKRELPNYQVFDERRYFMPGQSPCVFDVHDGTRRWRLGLLICEDAWSARCAVETAAAGAEALCVLNASPYHRGKGREREAVMRARVAETGLPLVYAHLVGGQDELVFDGGSFALDAQGRLAARAPAFVQACLEVELSEGGAVHGRIAPASSPEHELWSALVLGTRDYIEKNGFPGAIVGLSGGVDSALVLAIAVDALGPQRVRAVMMPSPYTAEISWLDAREMAARLGVRYDEIPIGPLFDGYLAQLAPLLEGRPPDTTEENLQARIRGTLLMALSNKFGDVVLTTGNKSELATGYCTLYGDMAGGFAVIKDLTKTWVWRLARWRNAHDPFGRGAQPIPERIITRAPSAELRPGQTDQDSLPPYEVLDAIVERYVERDESLEAIVADGFDRATVERVVRLIRLNEYKRRQAPVGLRVTPRAFGRDWRYPITHRRHPG